MQPNSSIRVLRLLGAANMGKSHLISQVFPKLVREKYHANMAILDLDPHNFIPTVPEILHMICSQLDPERFHRFCTAYEKCILPSGVEVQRSAAIFSNIIISAKEARLDMRNMDRYLTTEFFSDLRTSFKAPLVLLFDSVDCATEDIQAWLMKALLVSVSRLENVRVVVTGRSMPQAHKCYNDRCRDYKLQQVTEEEEYMAYCREIHAVIVEQSVRDLARFCNYTPGLFAEGVLTQFVPKKVGYGSRITARAARNK
jgi:hypothetical protein